MVQIRVDVARLQERQTELQVARLESELKEARAAHDLRVQTLDARLRQLEEDRTRGAGARWAANVGWTVAAALPGFAGLVIALINLLSK